MADISAEIAAFKNAVYGEDVRDAMVSLANKLNTVVTESASAISLAENINPISKYLYRKDAYINYNTAEITSIQDSVNIGKCDLYRINVKNCAFFYLGRKSSNNNPGSSVISANNWFATEKDGTITTYDASNAENNFFVRSASSFYYSMLMPDVDYVYIALNPERIDNVCLDVISKSMHQHNGSIRNVDDYNYKKSSRGVYWMSEKILRFIAQGYTSIPLYLNSGDSIIDFPSLHTGLNYTMIFIGSDASVVTSVATNFTAEIDGVAFCLYKDGETNDKHHYVPKDHDMVRWNDIKNRPSIGDESAYYGLLGVAFGTSLTYRSQTTGGYLSRFEELSGMIIDNQGIGSSGFMAGTTITSQIMNYSNFTNKRVALLEGSVNDWYTQQPLGTYTDTTTDTVCGCLRSCLEYIFTSNPKIQIFMLLDHYGNGITAHNAVRNNLTQYQYYEELAKVCENMGVPVLKVYADSNMCTQTSYMLIDNIHLNSTGVEHVGNLVWNFVKSFTPKVQ